MNRADLADPNDELTRLLRTGAEAVPFAAVDWAALRARIQEAISNLSAEQLHVIAREYEEEVLT